MAFQRNRTIVRMGLFALLSVFVFLSARPQPEAGEPSRRWIEDRARSWADSQPWTLGCNYIPRTVVNTLEMWQAETFDPQTIDEELGWAEGLGFNAVRVFLHYLLWDQDPGGFLKRLEHFLSIADKHHIGTMFVLFDDCWNAKFRLGAQPAPRPGVHNSGWVQCPGPDMLEAPARWGVLEDYTRGVIGFFREDRRVLAWDLYNEPGNSDYGPRSLPLLEKVFAWARAAAPSQPLTAGIWGESREFADLNRFQAENSDIISFHAYTDKAGTKRMIDALKVHGRPLLCTEYMARTAGSRFEDILPLFKAEDVGAMNWGFVSGKTQTIYPWGSKRGSPEPAVWFHDILRADGTPFAAAEVGLIRALAGKARAAEGEGTRAVSEPFQAWALTPPLGWNSWDSFGQAVTEDEVKANADFMAAKLAKFGWRYIVVDIEWYEPQRLGPDYPVHAKAEVDAFGRFVPALAKFPSAAGGRGFKPLADYVHRKGLKFGVHIVRGIPRLAVERNTPIEGAPYGAADIADETDYCDWNEDQWGVDVRKPGAQEWYDSLLRQLASWGVDFVKADDLCYRGEEIAMLRKAIDRTGRPIVLSLSYGPMPLDRADALVKNANMWRLLGDLWDYWDQVLPAFRRLHDWSPYAGPGHWPEPDMLPLGHLRFLPSGWSKNRTMNHGYFEMTSHGGREDVPNFLSRDEQRTIMTLWAIVRCPLMFGGHLPASDDWTVSLITNAEVLAVDQRSRGNRQLFHANGLAAWTADDPETRSKYIAVFNTSDRGEHGLETGVAVPVRLSDLGLTGPIVITDVWSGKRVGVFSGEFAPVIPYHGAGLYRLTPQPARSGR
jgi:alpha-galactosidase